MSKPETHFMIVHETVAQSWGRDASAYALAVSLIGTGWFLGSEAMQWFGAIVTFITISMRASGKVQRLSPSEARAKIDEIEQRMVRS
jgi:hypothetical protein